MARKIKKICVLCGNEYEIYCVNCREAINQPTWKNSFCCENCRDIYSATAGYFGKSYSAQEAKVLLDMCDLSNKEHFTKATQRLIDEIYSEDVGVDEDININTVNIEGDDTVFVTGMSVVEEEKQQESVSETITVANSVDQQTTKTKNYKKKNKK